MHTHASSFSSQSLISADLAQFDLCWLCCYCGINVSAAVTNHYFPLLKPVSDVCDQFFLSVCVPLKMSWRATQEMFARDHGTLGKSTKMGQYLIIGSGSK